MKIIFLILITVCFISCKEKPKPKAPHMEIGYSSADTSISQDIWYYREGYVLATTVKTNRNQNNGWSNRVEFQAFVGDRFAPYYSEIYGPFDYIKKNKSSEYKKGLHFIDSIKPIADSNKIIEIKNQIQGKLRNDSIELLKRLPLYDSTIFVDNPALDGISVDKGIYKYKTPN